MRFVRVVRVCCDRAIGRMACFSCYQVQVFFLGSFFGGVLFFFFFLFLGLL